MVNGIVGRPPVRICKRGHDKDVTGRLKSNGCRVCGRMTSSRWRKRQPKEWNHGRSMRYYNANREKCLARNRKSLTERQVWVSEIKIKTGCKDCGYNKAAIALDFDHLMDKTRGISEMIVSGFSKEKILAEIAKCDVVCSNCHRIRTSIRALNG